MNIESNQTEKVYNTGETETQLREEYNPEGSTLRKAQLRMLDMLDYIDAVCREQGISYRLDSGNVLGAVRHGGFIPWDDDVDIALSWNDYNRLCRYLVKNPHPVYVLQSPKTDSDYLIPLNKLRDTTTEYVMDYPAGSKDANVFERQRYKGLQIDLFPFDDCMLPVLQRLAGKMACFAAFDVGRKYPFLGKLIFVFNQNVAFPLFRMIGRVVGKRSLIMHSYGTWFYKRYSRNMILPYGSASFEDRVYPVPADSDAFCRAVYGSYEHLPPREKRQWHAKDVLWKDKSTEIS